MLKKYLIIDFDSTFVSKEGLEELANISLAENKDREVVLKELKTITDLGMEGKLSFRDSLERRFSLFQPKLADLDQLILLLRNSITHSILENKDFFLNNSQNIYIISGGFREWIEPIVEDFGIIPSQVIANEFLYNDNQEIIGFDDTNPLSNSGGKAKVVSSLALTNEVLVIGDGYTDFEIKAQLDNATFIAFTENVKRENVITLADKIAPNWQAVLNYL